MDFSHLDKEKVCNILMRVPLVSMQLNHKQIRGTVRDYVIPKSEELEAQFVRDLFAMSTDDVIDKWYGGKENAMDLLFGLDKQKSENNEE